MIAIAPMDPNWFNQLRSRPHGNNVNFWTPTPWNIRKLKTGDRFHFLLKAPIRKIRGFGYFARYENMRASEAWTQFGLDTGVLDFQELVARTGNYADKRRQRGSVLALDGRYSFDVLLDNIVTPTSGPAFLQNRSETFTGVYATLEPSALLLLTFGAAGLAGFVWRRHRRP